MSQNFLYSLECLVDDILVTRPNECAPDEYPTCVEFNFQTNVYLSICEEDITANKKYCSSNKQSSCQQNDFGKYGCSCLFSLDQPVTDEDKLQISVVKKKVEKCKFLIGASSIPIKHMFEKITKEFVKINPHALNRSSKSHYIDDPESDDEVEGGRRTKDDFVPASDVTKKLLSIFNRKGQHAGNLVIFVRLSCVGPLVISSFLFDKDTCGKDVCKTITGDSKKSTPCCEPKETECTEEAAKCTDVCPQKTCNGSDVGGGEMEKIKKNLEAIKCFCEKLKKGQCNRMKGGGHLKHECASDVKSKTVDKHKGSKINKPNTCGKCIDEPRGDCSTDETGDEDCDCGGGNDSESDSEKEFPCILQGQCKQDDTREYDEFEANLNGSGIVIRVIKNEYNVKNVDENDENNAALQNAQEQYIRGGECNQKLKPYDIHKNLKKDLCGKLKKNKNRTCCLQVAGTDIDKVMKGISRRNLEGIEICRKGCAFSRDLDVFLLKFGKNTKSACGIKNLIELELKTPKAPDITVRQKKTIETQVDEETLDAELPKGGKRHKKGKGKKGKKK